MYSEIYNLAHQALVEQGFTFDIRLTGNVVNFYGVAGYEGKPCQLVEVNTFGLFTGSRSALVHRIKDYDLLYGSEQLREIEVRFLALHIMVLDGMISFELFDLRILC